MRVLGIAFVLVASNAFAPRIDSLSPSQGPIAGGTVVTITGSALAGATVTIDGNPVVPLSQSDVAGGLRMPPHDNGYALLSIRNSAGRANAKFLYVPPPLASLPAGHITTVAGVGLFANLYGLATDALINANFGFVFDGDGNTYIADAGGNRVYIPTVRSSRLPATEMDRLIAAATTAGRR